jgi:hypothetical protein
MARCQTEEVPDVALLLRDVGEKGLVARRPNKKLRRPGLDPGSLSVGTEPSG